MKMLNEIEYLNAKIEKKKVECPHFLYKYRPFDEYAIDMLENEYVYLSAAEKLDDPSECKVEFSLQDFFDLQTNRLTLKGIDMVMETIRPYASDNVFTEAKQIVYQCFHSSGKVSGPRLLDAHRVLQQFFPEEKLVPLINWLRNIPEKMNEPEIRKHFGKLLVLAKDARKELGICSLTRLKNNDNMWETYGSKGTGYCIEYDMTEYENADLLFPVIYQDNRECNILSSVIGSFIGNMIYGMSNGTISSDKSQWIRLFLTKDLFWEEQQEWRILGDANCKIKAPKIKSITLGQYISEASKHAMLEHCQKYNISVLEI